MAPPASITRIGDLGPHLAQIGPVHDLIGRCERFALVNELTVALMADTTGGMANCTDNCVQGGAADVVSPGQPGGPRDCDRAAVEGALGRGDAGAIVYDQENISPRP